MARKINKNEKEVVLNRNLFDSRLKAMSGTYKDLWHEMTEVYGMDITYNGLGSMIRGQNTWKLTYAWIVSDILNYDIKELFSLIDVDVEKKVKERLEWQDKYQN